MAALTQSGRKRYDLLYESCLVRPSRRAAVDQLVARITASKARYQKVGKALGIGVRFTWKEIEIAGRPKPGVRLSGRTAAWAERIGARRIDLSMTHSRELAAAVCLVEDG